MTREEFCEKWFHEFFGMVCDGLTNRREGGELSMWIILRRKRVYEAMNQMWNDIHPPGLGDQPNPAPAQPPRPNPPRPNNLPRPPGAK